jgi:hypothetical protein
VVSFTSSPQIQHQVGCTLIPSHSSPPPKRCKKSHATAGSSICGCLVASVVTLLLCSAAHAQGGIPLVTVATDQSTLGLSNQFGVPASSAINQAGDFAFVGNGGTALFFRPAGASSAARLLQIDDEIPGLPGRKVASIFPQLGINSSRTLLFGVGFDGAIDSGHSALLTYDGTTFHTVVTSEDIAPGSGNSPYGSFLVPGSIDDAGDVNFAAIPIGKSALTFYILPAAGPPAKRVAALDDPLPPECTWCVASSSLANFFSGVPVSSTVFIGGPFIQTVPGLNAQGKMLLSLWGGLFIGSKDGDGISLVPMAAPPGACSPQTAPAGTVSIPRVGILNGFLNNSGVVAFTNSSGSGTQAICIATGGASAAAAVTTGDSAPAIIGGTVASPFALGMNDSGDIIFEAANSGAAVIPTTALLRYHQSNGQAVTDVVAYNCEPAPNLTGITFSPFPSPAPCGVGVGSSLLVPAFSGVSMANDGRVSFHTSLSSGESGIYRQTGAFSSANAPELIYLDTNLAPTPVSISGTNWFISVGTFIWSPPSHTKILDSGSVFFSAFLTGGAADFAEYLGIPVPGNLQTLMSTADILPTGAGTILLATPPEAAGHFVAFTAQPAGGRVNLLLSDLTTGTIKRVVSDNDPALAAAGGPAGSTVLAPNFFLNQSGQVAFETVDENAIWGGGSCGSIFLWSPNGGVAKVVAAGDPIPLSSSASGKFSCVGLNPGAPSPLNPSGQLAFLSSSPFLRISPCFLCGSPPDPAFGADGVFLYAPGTTGGISEMAAAGDTLPGETQPTTFVPEISVPVNSADQVAFTAQQGAPPSVSEGFFLRKGDTLQKVVASGDAVPGSSDTFGFPHFISGLTGQGDLAFTAATSTATDGIFLAPAGGGPIQTLALDGGPVPGSNGSTFSLGPNITGFNIFKNTAAAINDESDVVFVATLKGTGANSGYFRAMHNVAAGALQPVVLQGQPAPGGGVFTALPVRGFDIADFALGPDGTFAFVSVLTQTANKNLGLFVARPDGTLLKALATGDAVPGGGTLTWLAMRRLAAGDAGEFAFVASIEGGSARRAIFVTAIPPGGVSTTATVTLQGTALALRPTAFTATVSSLAGGPPTGTVSFFDGGVRLGPQVLNAGQATFTTSSLAAGPHSIVAQYGGDADFAPANSAALATIVTGFAPPPTGLTVKAGQTLAISLTLYGAAGSNSSFMLSCSGLPANSSCAFDQNSVTPASTGTPIKVTLSTTGRSSVVLDRPREGPSPLGPLGLFAMLSALLALGWFKSRPRPQRRLAFGACLAVLGLAAVMAGCGAAGSSSSTAPGPSGTPAGPAAITVTATSGTTTVSTVMNVMVQ